MYKIIISCTQSKYVLCKKYICMLCCPDQLFFQVGGAPRLHDLGAPISTAQTKYLELLARYYVLKGVHTAAARMLLILAERHCSNSKEAPALDQRYPDLVSASFVYL
jgi:hypothetical protein